MNDGKNNNYGQDKHVSRDGISGAKNPEELSPEELSNAYIDKHGIDSLKRHYHKHLGLKPTDRAMIEKEGMTNVRAADAESGLEYIQNMANKIANSANLKPPKVFVVDMVSDHVNKGKTKFDRYLKHGAEVPQGMYNGLSGNIIVSSKLINMMTEDELESVIGHEMGHQSKGSAASRLGFAITEKAGMLATAFFAAKEVYAFATIGQFANPLIPIGIAVGTAAIAMLGSFLSKAEEFYADAFSVKHTGKADSMISALNKLDRYYRENKAPKTLRSEIRKMLKPILHSHPTTENRAEKIRELKNSGKTYAERLSDARTEPSQGSEFPSM